MFQSKFKLQEKAVLKHGERYGLFPNFPFGQDVELAHTDMLVSIVTFDHVDTAQATWLQLDTLVYQHGYKGFVYIVHLDGYGEVTVLEESLSEYTLR